MEGKRGGDQNQDAPESKRARTQPPAASLTEEDVRRWLQADATREMLLERFASAIAQSVREVGVEGLASDPARAGITDHGVQKFLRQHLPSLGAAPPPSSPVVQPFSPFGDSPSLVSAPAPSPVFPAPLPSSAQPIIAVGTPGVQPASSPHAQPTPQSSGGFVSPQVPIFSPSPLSLPLSSPFVGLSTPGMPPGSHSPSPFGYVLYPMPYPGAPGGFPQPFALSPSLSVAAAAPPPPPIPVLQEGEVDLGHITVMHAAPLVVSVGGNARGSLVACEQLGLEKEKKDLVELLRQYSERTPRPNYRYRVHFTQATIDCFQQALDDGCAILHVSGHGVDAPQPALLFEDDSGDGSAKKLDGQTLHSLLTQGRDSLKLCCAILATCHSHLFAQAFLKAGVKCVIATTQKVQNKVAETFNKAFYKAVLRTPVVHESKLLRVFRLAFDHAIAKIKASEGEHEANIFQFHPQDAIGAVLALSPPPSQGLSYTASTEVTGVSHTHGKLPALVDHFQGRSLDMFSILKCILRERLVTVKGSVGVGKTALLRALALHMYQRKAWRNNFANGIYFVDLQGASSVEAMNAALFNAIKRQRDPKDKGMEWLHDDMLHLKPEVLCEQLCDAECVVFLDGCDGVLEGIGNYLTSFLDTCHKIRFVCASRSVLSAVTRHVNSTYELQELPERASEELLKALCQRDFSPEELERAGQAKELMGILSRHPGTIVIAAQMLNKKQLDEITEMLKAHMRNSNPGRVSHFSQLDATLDTVYTQLDEDARKLYVILGICPSGVDEHFLSRLWGGDGWKLHVETLVDHSLAVRVDNSMRVCMPSSNAANRFEARHPVYKLAFAYVVAHSSKKLAQNLPFVAHRDRWHELVCIELAKSCKQARDEWTRVNSNCALQFLNQVEPSVWACLEQARLLNTKQRPIVAPLRDMKGEEEEEDESSGADRGARVVGDEYVDALALLASSFAEMLRLCERNNDAKRAVILGLDVCEVFNNLAGEAACRLAAGKALTEARNIVKARKNLVRSLTQFAHTKQWQGYVGALYMFAHQKSHFEHSEYSPATLLQTLREIRTIAEQAQRDTAPYGEDTQAAKDMQLGTMEILDRMIKLSQEYRLSGMEADAYLLQARVLDKRRPDEWERARELCRKAMAQHNDDVFGKAEATKFLADLERRLNHPTEALRLLEDCRRLFQRCACPNVMMANVERTEGEIYLSQAKELELQGKLGEMVRPAGRAAKRFLAAHARFAKAQRKKGASLCLRHLAEVHELQRAFDPHAEQHALTCLARAAKLAESEKNPTDTGAHDHFVIHIRIVTILTRKSDPASIHAAEEHLQSAQRVFDKYFEGKSGELSAKARDQLREARGSLEHARKERWDNEL